MRPRLLTIDTLTAGPPFLLCPCLCPNTPPFLFFPTCPSALAQAEPLSGASAIAPSLPLAPICFSPALPAGFHSGAGAFRSAHGSPAAPSSATVADVPAAMGEEEEEGLNTEEGFCTTITTVKQAGKADVSNEAEG